MGCGWVGGLGGWGFGLGVGKLGMGLWCGGNVLHKMFLYSCWNTSHASDPTSNAVS